MLVSALKLAIIFDVGGKRNVRDLNLIFSINNPH